MFGARQRRRLVIVGGSNSVRTEGWVNSLTRKARSDWEVVNLSIGASTTLMGLYRLIAAGGPAEGDVIVWEYGINEFNHWRFGYPLEVIDRHHAWLIRLCAEAKATLLPVMTRTRFQAAMNRVDPYSTRMAETFQAAGLATLDLARLLEEPGLRGLPLDTVYEDINHYRAGTPVLDRLAGEVLARAPTLKPVDAAAGSVLTLPEGQTLELVTDFQTRHDQFSNSLVDCRCYPFGDAPRARLKGRVLGCIIRAVPRSTGFRLLVNGDTVARFATQPSRSKMTLLKQISFDAALHPKALDGEMEMRFDRPLQISAPRIVQPTYVWDPNETDPDARDGIVALLVERPREA